MNTFDPLQLLEGVDDARAFATGRLDREQRSEMGQFMTPLGLARMMASMFDARDKSIRLLDPGAGIGCLTAAFVHRLCSRPSRPSEISVTAYEIDPNLIPYLARTLAQCATICARFGISFRSEILQQDFIAGSAYESRVRRWRGDDAGEFDCAILNPPYKKISSTSSTRKLLASVGIETSNLYAAFMALVVNRLVRHGEMVSITPRSFCNGPYFRPFRELLLREMTMQRIHIFESRSTAFSDDDVLQENIILHAKKHSSGDEMIISSSEGPSDECSFRTIRTTQAVHPGDPELFIRILPDEIDDRVAEHAGSFRASVEALGLSVSTGRVVDFRVAQFLHANPAEATAPLIYPTHFENGFVRWPKVGSKKPNAITVHDETTEWLVPAGFYVVVKRFSSKEEQRRVVAAVYDPNRIKAQLVGFENHLNYYHCNGQGLPETVAKGLAVFLNSSLVDAYFRQFSGHTQVNATDLRSIRYPNRHELESLSSLMQDTLPDQKEIDGLIQKLL